jgi:hypothetical protein
VITQAEKARRYDELADFLRLCEDSPNGHAEFYSTCYRVIRGDFEDGQTNQCQCMWDCKHKWCGCEKH